MHRKKIIFRSPQSLIGLLNFACMVVCPSRAFLRHLVDLTLKMVSPFHFIILICEAITDLQAWRSFIETFNGKSVFLADTSVTSDHLKLFTDASLGSLGYAAVLGSLWFTKDWPSHLQHYQIAAKELFPIALALTIWGDSLKQNWKLLFVWDNPAVVEVISKQSCKDKSIMKIDP